MTKDISEKTFGLLTAKEIVGRSKRGTLWRCECECGGEKIVPAPYLQNHHTRSCGCIVKGIRENAIKKGDRFDMLEAVEFVGYTTRATGKRQAVWKFRCDCGTEKEMPMANVKFGNVRSCGCKAKAHITNLRKEDITGETFDRLTAIRPTDERDDNGSIVWEFACECGNTTKMSVYRFHTKRVHSCGCWYKESRKDCPSYRKDIVGGTSISTIVASKIRPARAASGHTGIYLDKRSGKWIANINVRKKRYYLGRYDDINKAVNARKLGEQRLHDPMIMQYWDTLTPKKQREYLVHIQEEAV